MITWPYSEIEMGVWMPLLGSGIGITFTPGTPLKGVLCDQLKVPTAYLENRIQTILVNSRPIDDPEKLYVVHGDMVALSAAMPGLVGTTLRRGSHLAAMRGDITLTNGSSRSSDRTVNILALKLFNMVAAELGPDILTGRIHIKEEDLIYLGRHYPDLPPPHGQTDADGWVEMQLPRQS